MRRLSLRSGLVRCSAECAEEDPGARADRADADFRRRVVAADQRAELLWPESDALARRVVDQVRRHRMGAGQDVSDRQDGVRGRAWPERDHRIGLRQAPGGRTDLMAVQDGHDPGVAVRRAGVDGLFS